MKTLKRISTQIILVCYVIMLVGYFPIMLGILSTSSGDGFIAGFITGVIIDLLSAFIATIIIFKT